MTQVWTFVCAYAVFTCSLWGHVDCEQCGPRTASASCSSASWVQDEQEETSLLQVHSQTSTRGKGLDVVDQVSTRSETPDVRLLTDQPKQSLSNNLMVKEAAQPIQILSSNLLVKASSELSVNCSVPDDPDACSKAVFLADSLTKLTVASENMVAKAAEVASLHAWFRNPAGPGGFFNVMDKDESQSLSASELSEHGASRLMELIDIDNDNECSREECRHFLRGCAVLFKSLPTLDKVLLQTPLLTLLNEADSVTMGSSNDVVATGHSSNPFTAAASELAQSCPKPAHHASCDTAVGLAMLLVNLTAGVPPNHMVEKGSSILTLWNWFQHPEGPVGLFNALDRHQQGAFTVEDFDALIEMIPGAPKNDAIPELVAFADTDKDKSISRAECLAYLRGCAVLLQKLPMLDLVSASKPLPDVLMLAKSVTEAANS